jgi:hypothetical protein
MTALVTDKAIEGIRELQLDAAEAAELEITMSAFDRRSVASVKEELEKLVSTLLVENVEGSKINIVHSKNFDLIFASPSDDPNKLVLVEVKRRPVTGAGFLLNQGNKSLVLTSRHVVGGEAAWQPNAKDSAA